MCVIINNNRRLVTLAEHTSDHGRQTNSSTEEKGEQHLCVIIIKGHSLYTCVYTYTFAHICMYIDILEFHAWRCVPTLPRGGAPAFVVHCTQRCCCCCFLHALPGLALPGLAALAVLGRWGAACEVGPRSGPAWVPARLHEATMGGQGRHVCVRVHTFNKITCLNMNMWFCYVYIHVRCLYVRALK